MTPSTRNPTNASITSTSTPLKPRGHGPQSYPRRRASQAGVLGQGNDLGTLQKQELRIYDEEGKDVTPKPLLPPPKSKPTGQSLVAQSKESLVGGGSQYGLNKTSPSRANLAVSAIDFFAAIESQTMSQFTSVNFSQLHASIGGGGGSRMSMSSMMSDTMSEDDSTSEASDRSLEEDRPPIVNTGLYQFTNPLSSLGTGPEISEIEFNKVLTVLLAESEMVTLLDMPSISISAEVGDVTHIEAANARYTEVLASQASNNNLTHRAIQTYNLALKNKDVQAVLFNHVDADVQVNEWSIFDDWAAVNDHGEDSIKGPISETSAKSGTDIKVSSTLNEEPSSPQIDKLLDDSTLYVSSDTRALETSQSIAGTVNNSTTSSAVFAPPQINPEMVSPKYLEKECTLDRINQENLKESLRIMECAVLECMYGSRYLEYREFYPQKSNNEPSSKNEDVDIPSIKYLWSFRCDKVRDRCVSAMSWNKSNPDILAVGYGGASRTPPAKDTNTTSAQTGLVCCWSLQNPEYPYCIYSTNSAVTSLDFSKATPNLLAVGFINGLIAIYDVKQNDNSPTMWIDSSLLACKHRDPIWQVRWIEKEQVAGNHLSSSESIVSISTDGRVCQWVLQKGINGSDLMALKIVKADQTKRIPLNDKKPPDGPDSSTDSSKSTSHQSSTSHPQKGNGSSSFISRFSGGLGFDFHPVDRSIYLVATEDGGVHKCSVSYNEQYLTNYQGHTGPVHRVKWSPYSPNIFATCSADWSVGIWHHCDERLNVKLVSGKEAVMDIDWSPHSPTVLASVSLDGRIEIWDFSHSALDPITVHSVIDQRLMCCLFGPKTPVLVTGGDAGSVNVYKLHHIKMIEPVVADAVVDTDVVNSFVHTQAAVLESLVQLGKNPQPAA